MTVFAHGSRADRTHMTRKKNRLSRMPSLERLSIWRSSIIIITRLPITAKVSRICCRWLAAPLAETHPRLNRSIPCPPSWRTTTKLTLSWTHREVMAKSKTATELAWADTILNKMSSWMKVIELHMRFIGLKSAACPCQKLTSKPRRNTIMVLSPNWLTTNATWKSSA